MPGFPLEAAHVVTSKHPQRNRINIHVEPFLRLRVGEATPVDERRFEISNSIKVYLVGDSFFYLFKGFRFILYIHFENFQKIIQYSKFYFLKFLFKGENISIKCNFQFW